MSLASGAVVTVVACSDGAIAGVPPEFAAVLTMDGTADRADKADRTGAVRAAGTSGAAETPVATWVGAATGSAETMMAAAVSRGGVGARGAA